jgi:hypothetical protein
MNGCFDQEICDGHLERKMQILCNKDEAVMVLQVAEKSAQELFQKSPETGSRNRVLDKISIRYQSFYGM